MKYAIKLNRAQLKVLSNVCGNSVVVSLIAMLGTRNPFSLTANILLAILFWKLAVWAERKAR